MSKVEITREQVLRIAAESGADVRTVRKIYEGGSSFASVRAGVTAAAKKLGVPAPPEARS